ncbi:Asp23/Gls24 family envelope stress response protein [Nonomuraea sp. CA-143628]|uniref:Asp23/Gls24 family envelope stress response protein n=1 Tax=Nonomuraea sp. CA-143628 TaxID=3239997 RepID=UPI003D9334E6
MTDAQTSGAQASDAPASGARTTEATASDARTAETPPSEDRPTDAPASEAQLVAERVRACAGVAGLSGGLFGTVATYLPGERLTGVSINDREVTIDIVARLGRPLPETAEEVRRAVADLAGDRPVNIRIDDVAPEDTVPADKTSEDSLKETSR